MWKIVGLAMVFLLLLGPVYAQEETTEGEAGAGGRNGVAFIAVALSTGLAAMGAGYAIAHAGAAAMGAITEKPETATWGLIIVALAEGIALYGLVISFMMLGKL